MSGPDSSGNSAARDRQRPLNVTPPASVCWLFIAPPSTPAGRISQASVAMLKLKLSTGPTLVLFVIVAFLGWTVLLTIYTSVRSHKFLQSIFLAGVKEL